MKLNGKLKGANQCENLRRRLDKVLQNCEIAFRKQPTMKGCWTVERKTKKETVIVWMKLQFFLFIEKSVPLSDNMRPPSLPLSYTFHPTPYGQMILLKRLINGERKELRKIASKKEKKKEEIFSRRGMIIRSRTRWEREKNLPIKFWNYSIFSLGWKKTKSENSPVKIINLLLSFICVARSESTCNKRQAVSWK